MSFEVKEVSCQLKDLIEYSLDSNDTPTQTSFKFVTIDVFFDQPAFIKGVNNQLESASTSPDLNSGVEIRFANQRAAALKSWESGDYEGLFPFPFNSNHPRARLIRTVLTQQRQIGAITFVYIGDDYDDAVELVLSGGMLINFHRQELAQAKWQLNWIELQAERNTVWSTCSDHMRLAESVESANRSCETDASFIQEQIVFLEEGVGIVSVVMKPVVNTFLGDLGEEITTMVKQALGDNLPYELIHSLLAGVPRLVIGHVSNAVARNVSNLVTDGLTELLVNKLTVSLTNALGPVLTKAVWEQTAPRIEKFLEERLKVEIPQRSNIDIGMAVARSMPVILADRLSRSISHALVPVLTITLSHTASQDYYCKECFFNDNYCSACHTSRQSLFYSQYYSAYYADYFTDYYTPYYVEAMEKIDRKLFDPSVIGEGMMPPTQHG